MKKILIGLIVLLLLLFAVYFIGTGFVIRHDVILSGFSLSEDGAKITLSVGVTSSAGYVRSYRDVGGGVKPHMLEFYSAFGGINGAIGATDTVVLPLDSGDTQIFFSRPGKGYQLVLEKNPETGAWQKPTTASQKVVTEESETEFGDLVYHGETHEFHDLVYRGEKVAILMLSEAERNQ